MDLFFIRIISLIAIGIVYFLFDIFNKRNIPSTIVYLFLAYSIILTILYLNINLIFISSLLCIAVITLGYAIYKIGFIGFGDITELASLSLIFPFFSKPLLYNISQLNIPLVISIVLNSGFIAIILIPILYIIKYKTHFKKPLLSSITNKALFKAGLIATMYSIFILFLVVFFGLFYIGIMIIVVFAIFSTILMLFETAITNTMVEYVDVKEFKEDELIAANLLDQKEIKMLKKEFKHFNRLITPTLISEMKQKKFSKKLPVYKEPIPFASIIFLGLIITILFGNVLFLIIPIH